MKTILKFLGNAVWILLLATIIFPIGWFVWRAGQPMSLPQYNGLTYYQFVSWRKNALHQMALKYHETYPNKKISFGLDRCFYIYSGIDTFGRLPSSSLYALAGMFPNRFLRFIALDERDRIPEEETGGPSCLDGGMVLSIRFGLGLKAAPHDPVPYCRLQPDVPTPEELKGWQNRSENARQSLDKIQVLHKIRFGVISRVLPRLATRLHKNPKVHPKGCIFC